MEILKFITAGNVDDGKSTLIGRLLHDTNSIKSDVLKSVSDKNTNREEINLAHITDGLRKEREQGITIDIAHKYFTSERRKYIIVDAPGHVQFTKNLVTGASEVDAMIILIDAQYGITEQTRRHSLIASFLGIKHIVVAINKMDIVHYSEYIFTSIRQQYLKIANQLQLQDVIFVPISALQGDNITFASSYMKWYKGVTLLQYLENCPAPVSGGLLVKKPLRFTINYIVETKEQGKLYYGKLLNGTIKKNDLLEIFASNKQVLITKLIKGYTEIEEAYAGQNVCLHLSPLLKNVSIKRGDILSCRDQRPKCSFTIEATIFWLNDSEPLQIEKEYFLRINAKEVRCTFSKIICKIDLDTFEGKADISPVTVNQFAKVIIETKEKIVFDSFKNLPENGRGIIINLQTNYTSAAFVIEN